MHSSCTAVEKPDTKLIHKINAEMDGVLVIGERDGPEGHASRAQQRRLDWTLKQLDLLVKRLKSSGGTGSVEAMKHANARLDKEI